MIPWVYYTGTKRMCRFIQEDQPYPNDPFVITMIGPTRDPKTFNLIILLWEENEMPTMFTYTDDKQRTISWGIDHDPGDPRLDPPRLEATYIACSISQTLTTLVEVDAEPPKTGKIKKERSVTVIGSAKQATAQEAWRIALGTLENEMKTAASRARDVTMVQTPQTDAGFLHGDNR